jgi:hypothetical protein
MPRFGSAIVGVRASTMASRNHRQLPLPTLADPVKAGHDRCADSSESAAPNR